MAAYVIVDTKINDPENYEEYKQLARPIAESYGGEYLARGGPLQIVESDLWSPERLVLLRFPEVEAAMAFMESDEYAPVAAMRHQYADSTVVIFEGE